MGGEREVVLEGEEKKGKKSDASGTVGAASGNRIRIHESSGEVHFHDDTAKIKAAVPVAEWWKAWEKLRSQPIRWEWIDANQESNLVVETQVVNGNIEATIALTKATVGTNFKELYKFTKRS